MKRVTFAFLLVLFTKFAFAELVSTPVSFSSNGETLGAVTKTLEKSLGLRIVLVKADDTAKIQGTYSGITGAKFLDEFSRKNQLEWALGKNEIYLAGPKVSEVFTMTLADATVAARLQDMIITQYAGTSSNITTNLENNVLHVSGIPNWINGVFRPKALLLQEQAKRDVRQASSNPTSFTRIVYQPKDPNENGLMIFQLHNAWADDKRIGVGGNNTAPNSAQGVAGVATLFRQFTGMPALPQQPVVIQNNLPGASGLNRAERVPSSSTRSAAAQNSLMGLFVKDANKDAGGPGEVSIASNVRGVYADPRMNALLVRDKVSLFETYKNLIASLDRPTSMVQLDAFVIDINRDKMQDLGLNFVGNSKGSATFGKAATSAGNIILNSITRAGILAKINALQSTGDTHLMTVPTVVAMNNVEAFFSARDTFYVEVKGFQDSSLNQVTAETLLRVTPLIANESDNVPYDERRVKLLLNIQDGTVNSDNTIGGLPHVLENQISTQAVVRSNDTLVIGGQIVRKRINQASGIPGLSTLPVLKYVFGNTTAQYQEYIRIYMVRPRILGEDSASAAAVATDKNGNINLVAAGQAVGRASQVFGEEASRPLPTVPIISFGKE